VSRPQVLVIGAGPAGIEAAVAARAAGAEATIVDEAPQAGGQVYRAMPQTFAARDPARLGPDHAEGERLRDKLKGSGVECCFGHRLWRITSELKAEAIGPEGPREWAPDAIIAATGAFERVMPFPGWTQPGVIGLAAATILLKAQHMLPGRAVVVAGCGPLLAAVAAGLVKGGGKVAAVVDLASRGDWLSALPSMTARPDLILRGLQWLAIIRKAGVPIYHRHSVARVATEGGAIAGVAIRPVDARGAPLAGADERMIAADCLAVGHGLIPSTEVSRALRAKHVYRAERGGWTVDYDDACRTSVKGLYVCGDGAGIAGAAAAALQGRLAGLTAAHDLGCAKAQDYAAAKADIRAALGKAERFGHAMARLMAVRPGLAEAAAPDTIVCRCEDVTRAEVEDAIQSGAYDVNQIKSWTRAGMGPCQGRMCGEIVGALAGARMGGREKAGLLTGRLPLRPVPMPAIIGEYRYEDIEWKGNKATVDDEGRPLSRG
jgi:thioredoxin reductase